VAISLIRPHFELLGGIEVMHMVVMGQMKNSRGIHMSAADPFHSLEIDAILRGQFKKTSRGLFTFSASC
jgi:hypothetical protein